MTINDFITANNLSDTDRKNLETMAEIYGHRIDLGTLRLTDRGWIVADLAVSERTAAKFADRLKRKVRASFMSGGRAGIKVAG